MKTACVTKVFPTRSHAVAAQGGMAASLGNRGSTRLPRRPKAGLEAETAQVHIACMPDSDEKPVMEPFPDKVGTGWHVVIRYHEGHERRIEGFATKNEAVDWITANTTQLDK